MPAEGTKGNPRSLGLERVKKWLYAKDLAERGAGCVLCGSCYGHGPVNPMEDEPGFKSKCPPYEFYRFQRFTPKSRWLMSQRVFHGLDKITPELKEVIYTCTTCLMCQEICGVRNDGYGPWDIGVAMREEITEKEGPLEAHRSILEGLQHHNNPWPQPRTERGRWAEGLGLPKPGQTAASTLLFAGCSADQPSGRAGALSLAKLLQRAGEDFAVLGESESCCGLYAKDLGFRREYYRLEEENSALVGKTGIKRIVTACASCHRIWKGYPKAALAGVEIRHGVEQLEKLVREGRLTFSPVARTTMTHATWGGAAGYTSRRGISCARFPASSWSRCGATGAGLGAVAAAAECRRPSPNSPGGTPKTVCARRGKPARRFFSPRAPFACEVLPWERARTSKSRISSNSWLRHFRSLRKN
ncbi:MAG: (Fe-S)-binding protein [Deltaproteobacteria bacterium]|nr:(Fe-S)-binding protein [Deltaproteobacteria bacterium]